MEMKTFNKIDKARDTRWSQAIGNKYGWNCPHCSGIGGAHHIVPRGCLKTRYILDNGIYACDYLHRVFERPRSDKTRMKYIRLYVTWDKYRKLWEVANDKAVANDFGFQEVE